jgi:hypothetical protein
MSRVKGGISSSGNSNYGWFANGYNISPGTTFYSDVERLDYSNDTVTNSVRSNSSHDRHAGAGAGNANYGWHGAGQLGSGGARVSLVDRLDYSNDTNANASRRGSLTASISNLAAVSNYVK